MEWRHATTQDVPVLAEFNHQLIADEGHRNPMNVDQLAQRMVDWLNSEYTAVLFLDSDEVVAYALFRPHELDRVYLRQLFVVRHRRRQGLGRQAMRLLREEIIPPTKPIILEVLATNAPGRAFWSAAGFREYAITLELPPK
jgi:ribosomal protein S18 acetylase RimI-like enzyme